MLVIVNDIDLARAETLVEEIVGDGGSAAPVVADISDSRAVDSMFDEIESRYGDITTLVNNAGVSGNAPIRNVTDDYWRRVLSIDLDGAMHCTRRALSRMRELQSGSIVSVSSRAWLGWWGQSAYAAAKAGVVGISRALAIEVSSRSIRLNVVAPGLIDTPMLRAREPEALAKLLRSVPVGTAGAPDDVAAAVAFLASDRARCITGQVLYVCGGKSVYAYPDWAEA
jgi:NAD(P)-dependent dehydrogenase (short-subunit alcohol dehydrogenase family)